MTTYQPGPIEARVAHTIERQQAKSVGDLFARAGDPNWHVNMTDDDRLAYLAYSIAGLNQIVLDLAREFDGRSKPRTQESRGADERTR